MSLLINDSNKKMFIGSTVIAAFAAAMATASSIESSRVMTGLALAHRSGHGSGIISDGGIQGSGLALCSTRYSSTHCRITNPNIITYLFHRVMTTFISLQHEHILIRVFFNIVK